MNILTAIRRWLRPALFGPLPCGSPGAKRKRHSFGRAPVCAICRASNPRYKSPDRTAELDAAIAAAQQRAMEAPGNALHGPMAAQGEAGGVAPARAATDATGGPFTSGG